MISDERDEEIRDMAYDAIYDLERQMCELPTEEQIVFWEQMVWESRCALSSWEQTLRYRNEEEDE